MYVHVHVHVTDYDTTTYMASTSSLSAVQESGDGGELWGETVYINKEHRLLALEYKCVYVHV